MTKARVVTHEYLGIQQLLRYFQISLIIMQIVFYVHLIDVTVLY